MNKQHSMCLCMCLWEDSFGKSKLFSYQFSSSFMTWDGCKEGSSRRKEWILLHLIYYMKCEQDEDGNMIDWKKWEMKMRKK